MKRKRILGISAFYHDSAAALIHDEEIIGAVQEERFSRIKNDENFPLQSIKYLKDLSKIKSLNELDAIVFYEKPFLKFSRLLETYIEFAPKAFRQFSQAIPVWTQEKFFIKKIIKDQLKELDVNYEGKNIFFSQHHYSHASSAFFPSPFTNAVILCLDGVGEWSTSTIHIGNENKITLEKEIHYPHSLGLLYSAFTFFLGFKVNEGEYKMMGLAPYGIPKYENLIKEYLLDIKKDGSFRLNLDYFDYITDLQMTNSKFEKLFKLKKREPSENITLEHMNIASSIQKVTEDIILKITNAIYDEYKIENLCLAGGVALNCVANGKIIKEGKFKNIWIQPAAGDAGGSLGAALGYYYKNQENLRKVKTHDSMQSSLLGPEYNKEETESMLKKINANYSYFEHFDDLTNTVTDLIIQGKIIGWFQGRTEFGPRALGNRSILADPRGMETQKKINLKIKFRESFRPFAPIILEEYVEKYFGVNIKSKYMLIVLDLIKKFRNNEEVLNKTEGFKKLDILRSDFQSITHVDYSARLQTVSKESNFKLYKLLNEFYLKTKCPILINTSFNINNEPIVNDIYDAYKCFLTTDIDILVCNNFLLKREDQFSL